VLDNTLKLVAGTEPKTTSVAPVNPVPVMVTVVPPLVGPELGEMVVMTGVVSAPAAAAQPGVPPPVVCWVSIAGREAGVSVGELRALRAEIDRLEVRRAELQAGYASGLERVWRGGSGCGPGRDPDGRDGAGHWLGSPLAVPSGGFEGPTEGGGPDS
jgi:hypothetical protein